MAAKKGNITTFRLIVNTVNYCYFIIDEKPKKRDPPKRFQAWQRNTQIQPQNDFIHNSDDSFISFARNENGVMTTTSGTCDTEESFDTDSLCSEEDTDTSSTLSFANGRIVRFNLNPTTHVVRFWNFAHRSARRSDWEMYARDRSRFQLRIQRTELHLNPILTMEHRFRIHDDRFAEILHK